MSDPIIMPTEARQQAMVVKVPDYLRHLTLRLFQNDVDPSIGFTLVDFVEADFPGYVAQSLNDFSDLYVNGVGQSESDSSVHTFVCDDTPDGGEQIIYGWYTEYPEGELGPCARFQPPPVSPEIHLTGAGQSVSVQILFKEGKLDEEV